MLVGVRQLGEKGEQVLDARNAVPLSAHDQRRYGDLLWIDNWKIAAHVDISARWHRSIERGDCDGESVDDFLFGGAGMIAVED